MCHVQRPRGVGRHELHKNTLPLAERAVPVTLAQLVDSADLAGKRVRGEEEVDESGARDLSLGHERACRQRRDDRVRQLARVPARGFCEAQGHVGCKVTMLGIARALHADHGRIGNVGEERPGELL